MARSGLARAALPTARGLSPCVRDSQHHLPPFLRRDPSPASLTLRSALTGQCRTANRPLDARTKRRLVVDRRRDLSASRGPQDTGLPMVEATAAVVLHRRTA